MKYDLGLNAQDAWDAATVAAGLPDDAPGTSALRRLASDEVAQLMNRYMIKDIDTLGQPDAEYASSFLALVRDTLHLTDEQVDAVLVPNGLGTLASFLTPLPEDGGE